LEQACQTLASLERTPRTYRLLLHNPSYREKYAINLKRDLPRIPFYPDFWQWAKWGEMLMDLHIGYRSVAPFEITRTEVPDERARKAGLPPKTVLKSDRESGQIKLDTETTLSDLPESAWDYRLGNRTALDWILDQYRERTPRDSTVRARFNDYRFADYKETVVDLVARVAAVSVETARIVGEMRRASRANE
jgi:predicted helicase